MPRTLQSEPVHTQQWVLEHDRPQTDLPLAVALQPLSITLHVNGRLVDRQDYAYKMPGPRLTIPWVLLKGDTVRVTGRLIEDQ